jgi:endonuclease/exonuclease/phosphatase family metal-dependent hydrolase
MHIAVAPLRAVIATLTLILAASLLLVTATGAEAKAKKKPATVKVMTRNLFLGADLGPALEAGGPGEFITANGQILNEVDSTIFGTRARALADEILQKKPDLVGLQEVALWREDPIASLDPVFPPGGGPPQPQATIERYDFLEILMDKLNRGENRYKVAVVQNEFDFEAPGDENGRPDDGEIPDVPSVPELNDAELNGRLTMRDAILVKKSKKVKTKNPRGGNFANLLEVEVGGVVTIPVTRGWTRVEAKVGKGPWFSFTNTHFEAFDDETETPSIRQLQAREIGQPDGYAESSKPTVLVGDLNSDDDSVAENDQKAFDELTSHGWVSRSTEDPMSCCVNDLFAAPASQFDHHIDHVMTQSPSKVKLLASSVTGRALVNGIYPSDHAGVFSKLKIKP